MHGPMPPDGSPPTGANRKQTRARPDCSVELSSPHRRASPRNPGWRLKGAEVLSEVVRQRERRARVALRRARRNEGAVVAPQPFSGGRWNHLETESISRSRLRVGAYRQGVPGYRTSRLPSSTIQKNGSASADPKSLQSTVPGSKKKPCVIRSGGSFGPWPLSSTAKPPVHPITEGSISL